MNDHRIDPPAVQPKHVLTMPKESMLVVFSVVIAALLAQGCITSVGKPALQLAYEEAANAEKIERQKGIEMRRETAGFIRDSRSNRSDPAAWAKKKS